MQGSNLRPSAPKADALPGCANVRLFYSTICMFTSQAIWWDHLDLNQESTNYEFAALTNYAIVPNKWRKVVYSKHILLRRTFCLANKCEPCPLYLPNWGDWWGSNPR